jgi:Predicted restriction endonuclease
MKIWVGVTDNKWYDHLARMAPDEVNFWQPSGSREFRALQPGEPFLFKLHSPENYIVGGGFFVRYSPLPTSMAWDAFEQKNGVASLGELLARVRRYRSDEQSVDPVIGCNVLAEPFFLPRSAWIPVPASWAMNIVQGKTYDTESDDGQTLWNAVQEFIMLGHRTEESRFISSDENVRRFGAEYLTRGRLGQGAFRVLVTDAYQRRCAVTGERTLPVLEAAHIRPYASEGPHSVSNGMLLRSDLHKLFDLGYLTVTPELRLEVSPRLRAEWKNGREYYAYHGKELMFKPSEANNAPSGEFLRWHNENRFIE